MFLVDRRGPRERAVETWREAANLVSIRWLMFLESKPPERRGAFAAYVAALDAEEAAAERITRLAMHRAA
jgi:hypothetical protein